MTEHQSPTRARLKDLALTVEQKQYFVDHGAEVAESVVILGRLPAIKNKLGGRLVVGEHTILNSDGESSNTPIPNPVKFVIGIDAEINIGRHCDLNGVAITAYRSVTIGDRVQIGAGGLITDTDLHPVDPALRRRQIMGEPFPIEAVAKRPVVIGDDVWIGYGVIVLKGVQIGRGSIVGAGSVVTRDVPPSSVVAGNPARVTKTLVG